jgi:YspA, cpYpsA-related SLOG family
MNVAIVGSRGFTNRHVIEGAIRRWMVLSPEGLTIVSGGARGADSLGEDIARALNLRTIIHLPDWDTHGKAAGFIRNRDIVRDADVVLAFLQPGPATRGTSHTISLARDAGKMVYVYHEGKWS